jgi:hypothetical protein
MSDRAILRELCLKSIDAAIKSLCEVGSWPRPARARLLRIGHDFYGDDLRGIEEVDAFIDFLASQEEIKLIYLNNGKDNSILWDYWIHLLMNILTETEGTQVSRTVFHKWFERFVTELYSDKAVWRSIYTIDGLVLLGKELRLDEFTTLTSVPGENLASLVPRHDNCFNYWDFVDRKWGRAFPLGKATLVTTVKINKREYYIWPDINVFNTAGPSCAAIAAIRLAKPGSPSLHCHAEFQISDFPLVEPLGYVVSRQGRRLYEKETIIGKSDYYSIRSIWKKLMKTGYGQPNMLPPDTTDRMDIAIGRFLRSYEIKNWFENLLDLTIALEALFQPTDNEELSHRISLRCAWLLTGDRRTEESIQDRTYDCVRAMYRLRSAIVHGSSPKTKDIEKWISILARTKYERSKDWELRELAVESARGIVRRSIRACMKLSEKPPSNRLRWPFPDDFDRDIPILKQQRQWQKAAGIPSQ